MAIALVNRYDQRAITMFCVYDNYDDVIRLQYGLWGTYAFASTVVGMGLLADDTLQE